jgi:hypothetical protein
MNHGSSIAALVLSASLLSGCGEKSAKGGELGSSAPAPGSEGGTSGKSVAPTLEESVEYDDAGTPRKLWISKDLVAEFNPSTTGKAAILSADPTAKEVEQPQPVVRLWKLSGPQRGEAFSSAVTTPLVRVSPVVHEGPSEGLPMRALPGGVIATFKPDWDRARIDAWLALRSLSIQGDPVSAEANMYLVGTAPGLAALAVAKELAKTGELKDVTPNFWLQNTAK